MKNTYPRKETESNIYITFNEAEVMTETERKELEAQGKQIIELPIEIVKAL